MQESKRLELFERLSAILTGFSISEIQGTGLSTTYLKTIENHLGVKELENLLISYKQIGIQNEEKLEIREHTDIRELLHNAAYKNTLLLTIKLWYTGQWYGEKESYIISSQSYLEGLVWKAIRAHPMGGKQPGFGTWGFPPLTFSS